MPSVTRRPGKGRLYFTQLIPVYHFSLFHQLLPIANWLVFLKMTWLMLPAVPFRTTEHNEWLHFKGLSSFDHVFLIFPVFNNILGADFLFKFEIMVHLSQAILRRRGFSESFSFTPRVVAFASSPRAFLVKDRYTALMANYPDLTRPLHW